MNHTLIWHDLGSATWQAGGLEWLATIYGRNNGTFSLYVRAGDLPERFIRPFDTLDAAKRHAKLLQH